MSADSTSGAVRPGRLYRAGELTQLDDAGSSSCARCGITDVADLRSAGEVERHGSDLVPDGVVVHLLPFVDVVAAMDGESPHEHAFERLMTEKPDDESVLEDAAKRYMTEEYIRFAKAPGARRAVHRTVTLLGGGASVLTHCFAGKDRTGFSVAVVLDAVGYRPRHRDGRLPGQQRAVPQLREQILVMMRRRFDGEIPDEAAEYAEARLSDDVLGVHERVPRQRVQDRRQEQYGSVAGYLRAAGVTDEEIAALRTALRG